MDPLPKFRAGGIPPKLSSSAHSTKDFINVGIFPWLTGHGLLNGKPERLLPVPTPRRGHPFLWPLGGLWGFGVFLPKRLLPKTASNNGSGGNGPVGSNSLLLGQHTRLEPRICQNLLFLPGMPGQNFPRAFNLVSFGAYKDRINAGQFPGAKPLSPENFFPGLPGAGDSFWAPFFWALNSFLGAVPFSFLAEVPPKLGGIPEGGFSGLPKRPPGVPGLYQMLGPGAGFWNAPGFTPLL